MLTSVLLLIFLLVADAPEILEEGLALNNKTGIAEIAIFTTLLIIYGCQIFRLLHFSNRKIELKLSK
jgi:hypothetical protein